MQSGTGEEAQGVTHLEFCDQNLLVPLKKAFVVSLSREQTGLCVVCDPTSVLVLDKPSNLGLGTLGLERAAGSQLVALTDTHGDRWH